MDPQDCYIWSRWRLDRQLSLTQSGSGELIMPAFQNLKSPLLILVLALFVSVSIGLSGCSHQKSFQISGEQSVAVMPFIKGRDPANLTDTLSCPFANFCYEETALNSEADRIMTELLHEKLLDRLEDRVFPLKLVKKVYRPLFYSQTGGTPLDIARKLGKQLGVDYVVVGNVWRYRERVGSSLGVSEPASVAFGLYLVNVSTGKAVWQDRFNETQQSLTENLLKAPAFFKRGARWLTARELARYGIEDLLKNFPLG